MDKPNLSQEILNRMIENIKKKNISRTVYGTSTYKDLFYCDNTNKICFSFTPRSGCSVCFQQFLHLVGLLDDALEYDPFVHKYRIFLNPYIKVVPLNKLIEEGYFFLKFIMNPYRRIISCFNYNPNEIKKEMTFREYLSNLIENKDNSEIFTKDEIWHHQQQFIPGEMDFIDCYYVVNDDPTLKIKLLNGEIYTIDLSQFKSIHHTKKTKTEFFCGDIKYKNIINRFPEDYKYFYDKSIKKMVKKYFNQDINIYKFKFIYEIDE